MTKTSSKASVPLLIEGHSISEAYGRLLLHIMEHSGVEIAPLVLTVDGFPADYSIPEDPEVRQALDTLLHRKRKTKVEDVAFTIFPERLWIMAQGDRAKLFQFYGWSFPFYRARDTRQASSCRMIGSDRRPGGLPQRLRQKLRSSSRSMASSDAMVLSISSVITLHRPNSAGRPFLSKR